MIRTPEREALWRRSVTLHGHGHADPAAELEAIAAWCRANQVHPDEYGQGQVVEDLERKVADLLGFEAGRFLPSGTMAQQIALRVWCERARRPHFGMHPTAHLELHEHRGYRHLHGLDATLVGPRDTPLLAVHLQAVVEPLGALLVELPTREAGGRLPTWEQLEALKAAAAERALPLHLDGARLWECGPAYGRALAEITAGFSSCYVSFYKGIGAFAGSMLLGTRDFLAEAMIWQKRHGGTLVCQLPNVASAALHLDERLARMPLYLERARAIALAIRDLDGVRVVPDPPHVNLFHVVLDRPAERLYVARDAVAAEQGLWLFKRLTEPYLPGTCQFELYVGDSALGVPVARVREAFRTLLALSAG